MKTVAKLQTMRIDELRAICRSLRVSHSGRTKEALIANLLAHDRSELLRLIKQPWHVRRGSLVAILGIVFGIASLVSFLLWFVPSDSIGKKDGDRILAAIENFERRWSSLSATDAEERKGIVGEFQKLRQQFESNHGNMLASDVDSIRSRFGVTDCCGNSDHPLDELGELADEALGDVLVDPGCTY